jgi:hypothetical protein
MHVELTPFLEKNTSLFMKVWGGVQSSLPFLPLYRSASSLCPCVRAALPCQHSGA